MSARVSLEIALRKEFDYLIPPGLAGQVEVGTRVQVPFGARKIFGTVTALAEESAHANLKPILKIIGAQTLVTPMVLKLARWIAEYYCCAPETALKSVLPEAIRNVYDTVGMLGLALLFLFGGRFIGVLVRPVVGFFDALLTRL